MINHPFWGTAEPLDKNRLRIFQPTPGFLSAIGGKYGNYERGYPGVLNGLFLRGSYGEGFANSFWRGVGLQRRRGEEKNCLGSVQGLAPEKTRQHRQDKPRQAKGSLRGQMTYSEPGLCLAEAVGISLGDPVRGRIFLGPYRVCPRHGSSAVHNFSFEK